MPSGINHEEGLDTHNLNVFFLPFRPITSHPLLQYPNMSFLGCHIYLGRIAMHVQSIEPISSTVVSGGPIDGAFRAAKNG